MIQKQIPKIDIRLMVRNICTSHMLPKTLLLINTIQQECLSAGKFGKFGELSVIRQSFNQPNLAYKWYPNGRNLSICQTLFRRLLAIPQTLTTPNIPVIWYVTSTSPCSDFLENCECSTTPHNLLCT